MFIWFGYDLDQSPHSPTQQHCVPDVPSTTNQPSQQSPPTRNTFISTEAAPLSTMKNQLEKEKVKNKAQRHKWKKLRNQLKKEEESTAAFTKLIKIAGCINNNAGAPSTTPQTCGNYSLEWTSFFSYFRLHEGALMRPSFKLLVCFHLGLIMAHLISFPFVFHSLFFCISLVHLAH